MFLVVDESVHNHGQRFLQTNEIRQLAILAVSEEIWSSRLNFNAHLRFVTLLRHR